MTACGPYIDAYSPLRRLSPSVHVHDPHQLLPRRAIMPMPAARYRQMPMPAVAPPPPAAIQQVAPPPVIRLVPPAKRRRTIVAPVRLI